MQVNDKNQILEVIRQSEFVLVGIGDEWSLDNCSHESVQKHLDKLAAVLKGKTYFVISQNKDDLIFQSKLMPFLVTAPYSSHDEENWLEYTNWLTGTLGHTLCILELGVGLQNPQMIRWPFEKCAQINQKSTFVRIHHNLAFLPEQLNGRGISVMENSMRWIDETAD